MIYPEIEHKHHNKHTQSTHLLQTFVIHSCNRRTTKLVSEQSASEIDVSDISFRLCLIQNALFACLIRICREGSAFKLIVKFSLTCSVYDFSYLFIYFVCLWRWCFYRSSFAKRIFLRKPSIYSLHHSIDMDLILV